MIIDQPQSKLLGQVVYILYVLYLPCMSHPWLLQCAVASKNCPKCNHSFYEAKRISLGLVNRPPSTSAGAEGRSTDTTSNTSSRRTCRVKREKPNYYDASEFEKKKKVAIIFSNSLPNPYV